MFVGLRIEAFSFLFSRAQLVGCFQTDDSDGKETCPLYNQAMVASAYPDRQRLSDHKKNGACDCPVNASLSRETRNDLLTLVWTGKAFPLRVA